MPFLLGKCTNLHPKRRLLYFLGIFEEFDPWRTKIHLHSHFIYTKSAENMPYPFLPIQCLNNTGKMTICMTWYDSSCKVQYTDDRWVRFPHTMNEVHCISHSWSLTIHCACVVKRKIIGLKWVNDWPLTVTQGWPYAYTRTVTYGSISLRSAKRMGKKEIRIHVLYES